MIISFLAKYAKWSMFAYKNVWNHTKIKGTSWGLWPLKCSYFPNPYGHQRTVTCTLHGVPTLCEWEVARSLTLSSPFWIAVNTARSSCAIISEILVFREPRVWMSCCACVLRMSRGFSVSWSISHCRKGLLKVYVTPIQLVCVCVCIAATHVGNTPHHTTVKTTVSWWTWKYKANYLLLCVWKCTLSVTRQVRKFLLWPTTITLLRNFISLLILSSMGTGGIFSPPDVVITLKERGD